MRTAVMLACYNRKEMTERCLLSLKNQWRKREQDRFDIYVFDDGSTDGTADMLRESFPEVTVVHGGGSTFWCGSMYALMKLAVLENYDFYLMINDDVEFYENAVEVMFRSHERAQGSCGIAGTMKSHVSGEATYGGRDEKEKLVIPNGSLQPCCLANWNCFLVDRHVIEKVGIIDGKYKHSWGDFDFSFRMVQNHIPLYVAEEYVGECEANSGEGSYKDPAVSRRRRLKKLLSPKGLPFGSYVRYNMKRKGVAGLAESIYGYCSIVVYILCGKEIG